MLDWAVAALIGFASGVLSGAFGIGGGIVTTPAIRLIIGAPALIAVGTPLPVIIPSAITGALAYARRGSADLRAAVTLGVAGAATAVIGAMLASKVGGSVVLLGTAALIFFAAADTLWQIRRPVAPGVAADGGHPDIPPVRLVAMGLLTGLYSGFFGLGGGFVLVPMLTRWGRMPVKRAIGTSLATVALLAVPGTISHAVLGNIDWSIALGLAVGVIPGASLGARITLGARDRVVRVAFSVLLIVAGVWLVASEAAGVL